MVRYRTLFQSEVLQASRSFNGVCAVAAAALILMLGACVPASGPDAEALLRAYETALARTADTAVAFTPGSDRERQVLDRLAEYFSPLTAASARSRTTSVYAPTAWLFDNLAVVEGREAIEAYFVKATTEAEQLRVEFLQVARADADYFIRWRMSIDAPGLDDAPIVSYGVTQFRFDAEGRVLIHRDFWDASTGLYEYLPGLGGWMQRLRTTLGAAPEA